MGHHSSALYIKLKGSPCLTHVGTKGGLVARLILGERFVDGLNEEAWNAA